MPRTARTFPRYFAPRLREALRDSPAVLIHGPRQSGKTILLYDGSATINFRDGLFAVPVRKLWETT